MDSTAGLYISLLFGSIGVGYIIYGRKQQSWMTWGAGIVLCVYPYFVPNIWLMLLIGAGVAGVPFLLRDY
jgi:hypothetical protein